MVASALAKIWVRRGEEGLERVHWDLIAVRIAMHRFLRTSIPTMVRGASLTGIAVTNGSRFLFGTRRDTSPPGVFAA